MAERRPLVIVPTYNERDNLALITARLLALPGVRVLVVDDGSPDGTGTIADALADTDARVTVLHRTGVRGLGRSYVDGMRRALTTDATHICQIDADLSHNPADIPRLLDVTAAADLVIGSRYVPGGKLENWAMRRLVLSAVANIYVRAITRLPIHDCTSGFRCWRRDLLARIPLETIASDGYAFQVEMAWEAHRAGGRISEVPITFVERRQGTSKMSGRVIAESMLLPWHLVARPRIGPPGGA
ncbi:MAG: polyprenol monophosphomannose synthase [Acidobacteria bacterium]|nr:polyprenol monophosphomannose synthase [Acidobacteriota bacterium]